MTKTLNPTDILELAQSTGRPPSEILETAQREGWEITGGTTTSPTPVQSKGMLDNSKGATALMKQIKQETIAKLYKSDPLIREGIDAQMAIEASRTVQTKPSILNYDEQGNLAGVKSSVVSGIHATGANQAELMKAIKANIYKKYGVSE
tara:strand:- start:1339 stop:1785 length:447 start_codon:yes stop_codon:yes gene_type:complete